MSLNRITRNTLSAGLLTLIGLSVLFFLRSADGVFLADTEIWALHLTGELFQSTYEVSVYYKPLFHLILYPIQALDINAAWIFLLARWLFAGIGLALVYLTYRLTLKLSGSTIAAGFAALLLLTNTLFLSRGFRIRSDFLASLFHLVTMLMMLEVARREPTEQRRLTGVVGVLVTLMFLSTPKSLYFFLSQVIFFLSWGLGGPQVKRQSFLREMLKAHLIPVFAGLFLIALTGVAAGVFSSIPLAQAYRQAWEFFIQVNQSADTPDYWSPQAFQYIRRLIVENPVWSALVYISFVSAFFHYLRTRRQGNKVWTLESSFHLSALATLIFMIFHNHRVPFFIASMLPPLCVTSALFLARWLQHWKKPSSNRKVKNSVLQIMMRQRAGLARSLVFLVAVFVFVKAYRTQELQLTENSNRKQLHAISEFDSYLAKYPSTRYYDLVGSLPGRSAIFAFVGPGEKRHFSLIEEKLNVSDPDLLLLSNRLYLLEPFLSNRFLSWMVPIGHGVYARGARHLLGTESTVVIPTTGQEMYEVSWPLLQILSGQAFQNGKSGDWAVQVYPDGELDWSARDLPLLWIRWDSGALTPWLPGLTPDRQSRIQTLLVDRRVRSLMVTRYEPVRLPFTGSYTDIFRFDSDH